MKRFKKLLAVLLALVLVVGAINLPQSAQTVEAAAQQATLSLSEGHCQTGADQRWLIYLNITGATITGDIYWNNNTVYVDGKACSGSGVNYAVDMSGNRLMLCLTFAHAPNDGVTHTLLIPKGTVIGDIEVLNDFALVLGSDKNVYTATPVQLNYSGGGAQDGSLGSRYALNFATSGVTELTDNYWAGSAGYAQFDNTVYVNDSKVSGSGVNFGVSGTTLSLYLQYGKIKADVTTCNNLDPFTLSIPMGTVLGNTPAKYLVVTKGIKLDINKGTIAQVLEPDATVTLSNDASRNQIGTAKSGFYFFASEDDGLTADSSWATKYSFTTGGIYYNDSVVSGAKLVKILSTLYYVAFDGCGITFAAGDTVKIDGMVNSGGRVVKYEAQTFEYDGNGNWDIYVPATSYTPTLYPSTATGGIYFTSSDEVPYDGKWQLNYTAKDSESGVWKDGTRTEVFLKKITEDRWYVCLQDKGIYASRGTVVALKGTFENPSGDEVIFNEASFVYDGTKWLAGTELDWTFNITGLGNCEYDINSGWKLRFTTDNIVAGDDFATELGTYTIQVDGQNTEVLATSATDNGLGLLLADVLGSNPQGTVLTIPAGTIGDYTLKNDYQIIYDNGWQLYHVPTDVTLTLAGYKEGISSGSFVYQFNSDLIANGSEWSGAYSTSGVFVNGKKVEGAKLVCYAAGHFYLEKSTVVSEDVEDDIVTVQGVFRNGDTYVNFNGVHAMFNGESWIESHSYDNFIKTGIKIVDPKWQERETRWLVYITPSMLISDKGTNYAEMIPNSKITYTVVKSDETSAQYTTKEVFYAQEQVNQQGGSLGIIIPGTNMPSAANAEGYKLIINTGLITDTDKTYRLNESYTYIFKDGIWTRDSKRPTPTGIVGDANGKDGFGSADLVSIMKELEKQEGYLCTEDGLLDGKSKATKFDKIRITEMLLQGTVEFDENGIALGYPVYLLDEDIQLAAYMGPRSKEQDTRYDDEGNVLSGYEKTSFWNATEFKRYADAGLNTLIAESDAPFASIGNNGLNSGGGHWANIAKYMNLAKEADLDVYLGSSMLNAFLKGETTIQDNGGNTKPVSATAVEYELNEMLHGIAGQNLTDGNDNIFAYTGVLAWDNFKGFQLGDEIKWANRNNYATANQIIEKLSPDSEVLVSNLSASAGSSNHGGDYKAYAQFMGQNNASGEFTYNHYPYQAKATESGYFWNKTYDYNPANVTGSETNFMPYLQNSAIYAKEGGYKTGISIQSFGMKHTLNHEVYAVPTTKAQMGFQAYAALAYGVKSIDYFTYWEHYSQNKSGEIHTGAMVAVDAAGNVTETDTYRAVQAINREILQFDHIFLDYDWQTTLVYNADNGSNHLSGLIQDSTYPRIASLRARSDALVGCMKDPDKGYEGFWLVNADDPMMTGVVASNAIEVQFNNADQLIVYNPTAGMMGEIIDLQDSGIYTTTVLRGGAEFVIPIKLSK